MTEYHSTSCDEIRKLLIDVTRYYYSLPANTDDAEVKRTEDSCDRLAIALDRLLEQHKDCRPKILEGYMEQYTPIPWNLLRFPRISPTGLTGRSVSS